MATVLCGVDKGPGGFTPRGLAPGVSAASAKGAGFPGGPGVGGSAAGELEQASRSGELRVPRRFARQ